MIADKARGESSRTGIATTDIAKVSVAMIAYNQEKFVGHAIDSVLMQKTTFPIELIVAEDCSSDGTRRVVEDFADRYPALVRPICRERNLGSIRNFQATLSACQGEYIALLEGDDYWTSPDKLQLQVTELESKPAASASFHRVEIIHDGTDPAESKLTEVVEPRRVRCPGDLHTNFISTCSVIFRRKCLPRFPHGTDGLRLGDWLLLLLLADQGPIEFLDKCMAAYRRHPGGIWSLTRRPEQLAALAEMFELIGENYMGELRELSRRKLLELYHELGGHYISQNQCSEARRAASRALRCARFGDRGRLPSLLRIVARSLVPQTAVPFLRAVKHAGSKSP